MDTNCKGVEAIGAVTVPQTDESIASTDSIEWIIISKRDGKCRLLPRRMIFVGREECDIVLQSTTVDKRHAVIFFNITNQQFHVKDLNTSYGTYVNDKRIADQCYVRLQHSDRLRFGFGPDLFTIEKISSLPLTSTTPSEPLLISGEDSQQMTDKCDQQSDEKSVKEVKSDLNSDNIEKCFARKARISVNKLTKDSVKQLLNNCDNNSNDSLSTVDSLDGIKTTKDQNLNSKPVLRNNFVSKESTNANKDSVDMKSETVDKNSKNCLDFTPEAQPDSIGSVGSSPGPATAFIIAFDDCDESSNKKKMNIRDSIRQFAPPKPDSIEKPRPPKAKSVNNDLIRSENSYLNRKSPTNASKHKTKATKKTNAFSAGAKPTNNSINKAITSSIPSNTLNNICNETAGHLSDSATYLINRMLSYRERPQNSGQMAANIRSNSGDAFDDDFDRSPKDNSWPTGEKDSGVPDDKSETGTYTVDCETKDNELEDARNKIDQIFGVFDDSATISLNSSPDSSLISPTLLLGIDDKIGKSLHSIGSPKSGRKSNTKKEILDSIDWLKTENNEQIVGNHPTYTRPKRRVPTAQEMLHQMPSREEIKPKRDLPTNDLNLSKSVCASAHNSSQKNDLSSGNRASNAFSSQSAPSTPRSPLVTRKLIELQNKYLQKSGVNENQRKNSWNHSNSDLEYYESYNSDESTDHSHKSSNSALSKGSTSCASVPSKMRFNRAFALRRARLGIETPGIDIDMNRNKNKTVNTPASNGRPAQKSTVGNFSRSDGGRFSLRVPKNAPKDNSKKINNFSANRISSKESLNKITLQRKGSDPFTGRCSSAKSAFSDTDRNTLNNSRSNPLNNRFRQKPNLNNSTNFVNNEKNYLQKSCALADTQSDHNSTCRSDVSASQRMANNRMAGLKGQQLSAQFEKVINSRNDKNMGNSMTEPSHKPPVGHKNKSLELTALDGLVVSAINQLSEKLRTNICHLLEDQRSKSGTSSDTITLINEIMPQLSAPPERRLNDSGVSVSRDLSAILKNLKKVEQSVELVTLLLNPNAPSLTSRRQSSNAFFMVDI